MGGLAMRAMAQRWAARGMPSAVIADLVEAGRQDVLEEAPDELVAGDGFLALAVGGAVLVAIGYGLVVDGQDAVVGDGDAEGVAGEIVEGGLLSLAPWRDVNDPGDLPDMGRKVGVRAEPGEGVAEAGAGAGGERRFGEEEGLAGGMPGGAVIGQSAAGNQAMNVRMEDEPLRPGMQHGQHADGAAGQRGSRANTMIASAAAFISAP